MLSLASMLSSSGGACAVGADANGGGGEDPHARRRMEMVATQIAARDVKDPRVLEALRRVPRHRFVPDALVDQAYADRPLPIGLGQTISQPYIVALMTELVRPEPSMKVLEVGTGSGYQAAVLAGLVREVYTIEIVPELGQRAEAVLQSLGHANVHVRVGDGFGGWPEHAPFDAIVVTAAPSRIPPPLLEQLAPGGRLVIPVGDSLQELVLVTRTADGYDRRTVIPVRFVPMTGEAQQPPD
jgi:protein-L-isoaspartate(D-aspartate) O-methyltransferase